MISRFLDWLDESAAGVIRVAYLLAGVIAVASYFSDGRVPSGLALALNAGLPWVLAGALEIHTYLTARRVRRAYQDRRAAALDSDEYERASGDMRLNLWILGGLLSFSIYNQLQYLSATWSPPHTPLTPPGPFPYLIRAIVTPAAFMAAAFLAPVGEGMAVQVQAEAHRLATLTFKVARAQWKRQLRDMQQHGVDVTGALVQLVDEPSDRRVIEAIHAAMHPASVAIADTAIGTAPGTAPAEVHTPTRNSSEDAPQKPPTGPGTPTRRPVHTPRRKRTVRPRVVALPQGGTYPAIERPAAEVDFERIARKAWAEGHRTIKTMEGATGMSHSAAQAWVRALKAEAKAGAANSGKVAR